MLDFAENTTSGSVLLNSGFVLPGRVSFAVGSPVASRIKSASPAPQAAMVNAVRSSHACACGAR